MQARIDRKLNLVVPIERDEGNIYVHAIPLSREVFEEFFMIISKTFTAIYTEGLNAISGPRVAGMLLRKIAEDMGVWPQVQRGLVAEIRRTSSVVLPGERGWTTVPLQVAIDQKMLSEDEQDEAEGAITFFTVASAMHRRRDLKDILDGGLARLWKTQSTYSSSTDFATSLPTSIETDSTGVSGKVQARASSIPS